MSTEIYCRTCPVFGVENFGKNKQHCKKCVYKYYQAKDDKEQHKNCRTCNERKAYIEFFKYKSDEL